MDTFLQDLRFAVRRLVKSPGFTAVAVVTLALGIGATTAIFSVVDAVVLRPLPFPEPDQLVRVWETTPEGNDFSASDANYLDFRDRNRSFQELAAYRNESVSLRGDGEPERLEGMAVTHTLFPLLGATAAHGRTFLPEEDRAGGDTRVVVLGHDLWQRRFGADPEILGQSISLSGQAHTVIGVMRPGFDFPGTELWIPLAPDPAADRGDHWLDVVGRLEPGVSMDQARSDLLAIAGQIGDAHPHISGWGVRLASFSEWIVDAQFRQTGFVLLGAVGFLLLMACANLANLLFARATARQTEFGLRAALGARRSRIVRQLLTESVLLAALGAGAGLLGAYWAVEALHLLEPAGIPRLDEVAVDGRVLAFTLVMGLLTSLVFGLAPALRASRANLDETLRHGARGGGSRGERRIRDGLVVSQVALAMVVLVSAGLLMRSFIELRSVDAGFDPSGLLAVPLDLTEDDRYAEPWQKFVFLDALATRLEALPGIESAGATQVEPFTGWNFVNDVTPEHLAAETGPGGYMQAGWRAVTPGFFRTMGIDLVAGRLFSEEDRYDGPPSIVISETLARDLWPQEDPIGKRLFWGGTTGTPRTVVGVVTAYRDVELEADPPPLMFLPYNQLPWPTMTLVVRTDPGVTGVGGTVRDEIRAMDPNLPVSGMHPLAQNRSAVEAGPRFRTLLFGTFATIALLLACVGIYGVMAFGVAQRTREIGVRLALGARPASVVRLILRRGLALSFAGVAVGLGCAWALTRFLESLLYRTPATDAGTFFVVSLLLGGMALLAGWLPARRAARVDPISALRAE